MGKLLLSIIVGALLMLTAEKWQPGELSTAQVLTAVQDLGRNAGQFPVSMRR